MSLSHSLEFETQHECNMEELDSEDEDIPDFLDDLSQDIDARLAALPLISIACDLGWEEQVKRHIQHIPPADPRDCVFCVPSFSRLVFWMCSQDITAQVIRDHIDQACGVLRDPSNNQPVIRDLSRCRHFFRKELVNAEETDIACIPAPELSHIFAGLESCSSLARGTWVQVVDGRYRGDVGVVASATPEYASVLLAPHLEYGAPNAWRNKRQPSDRAMVPTLFDPTSVSAQPFPLALLDSAREKYRYRGSTYSYGLLFVLVPTAALDTHIPSIDSSTVDLFLRSEHPIVDARALPTVPEWVFNHGEFVRHRSTQLEGKVEAVTADGLTIRTRDNSLVSLRWYDAVKVLLPGDIVEVLVGPYAGRNGWIEAVNKSTAYLATKVDASDSGGDRMEGLSYIERFPAHLNSLRLPSNDEQPLFSMMSKSTNSMDIPLLCSCSSCKRLEDMAQVASTDSTLTADFPNSIARPRPCMYTGPTPWLGLPATITKHGHVYRNYPAIVRDVLLRQDTRSGLRIILEINVYQVAAPRRQVTVDYDHVKDSESGWELRLKCPLKVNQRAYQPPYEYMYNSDDPSRFILERRSNLTQFSDVPPTPPPPPPPPPPVSSEIVFPSRAPPRHWAVSTSLNQLNLRMIKNGKVLVCTPRLEHDEMRLYTSLWGRWREVEVSGIQAKHPKPRTDGPMVIIHGTDSEVGTLVRPVRHRYGEGWTVRVVKVATGQPDVITDEELVLPATSLCEIEETKESKALNDLPGRQLKEASAGH